MKKLFFVVLVLCSSVSFAQLEKQYCWYGTIGTSWVQLAKDTSKTFIKTLQLEVTSDDADGDTLWIAFNTDTTAANIFPLLNGESIYYPSVYISSVRLKSSDSVPYRVRIY
jgi:hypothetical protein